MTTSPRESLLAARERLSRIEADQEQTHNGLVLVHAEDVLDLLNEIERPQPRAEAETALTTAEDGTPHSPVPHVGAAATAENVAPKRPPSEPEQKPAHEKKAASVAAPSSEAVSHVGSTTGSAPEGGWIGPERW